MSGIDTIIRREEAMKAGGFLYKSSMYDAIAKGLFPAPIKITPKAVGWLSREIKAWQDRRIEERDATKNKDADTA